MKPQVKNRRTNRGYLKGIRDSLVRLEEGQKALHQKQVELSEWMSYHKGQHAGLKRNTAIVASLISAAVVLITKFAR